MVDHTLAESEVCVWQVGQSLQQNLGGHRSLEVGWVELVPAEVKMYSQSLDIFCEALYFSGLRWTCKIDLVKCYNLFFFFFKSMLLSTRITTN